MGVVTVDNRFYPTPGDPPEYAIPVPAINDHTVAVGGEPNPGSRRGIAIICHRTITTDDLNPMVIPNAIGDAFVYLCDQLRLDGWITLYPPWPGDRSKRGITMYQSWADLVTADPAHGDMLVKSMRATFQKILYYAKRRYNIANPKILIFGFSEGAWITAKLIKEERNSNIVGYMIHALPTLWDQLYQGARGASFQCFNGLDCSGINLATNYLADVTIPGMLGHAEDPRKKYNDGVLGYEVSPSLPPPSNFELITSSAYNGTEFASTEAGVTYPNAHLLLSTDVDSYIAWLKSTLDPGCPFVF